MRTKQQLWEAARRETSRVAALDISVDVSRMDLEEAWIGSMNARIARAFAEMADAERGAIVNTDEKRMVGHYWLRDPKRAPKPALRAAIVSTLDDIRRFAADVHRGRVRGQKRKPFTDLVVIGIGGSALGPELVADALGGIADRLTPWFIDNTDPDGMDRVFARLKRRLDRTLVVVISKSGETKETRNGMIEAEVYWTAAGLDFGRHAVAVTGRRSKLDKYAHKHRWIARFPMWDWVGGRTSVMSAVGLLPAALQGFDIDAFVEGARLMDEATRNEPAPGPLAALQNPSMALALAWHFSGEGHGRKDMVILPYKDRLALFSRYLQQLVMESLGKELDRNGRTVHQGIAVYGNKGSTDQHAYVQQLRDGVNNFFATFIEVLRDRAPQARPSILVEGEATSGDFLSAFLLGTRQALYESGRGSITITVPEISPAVLGGLIALYERAVGFYAAMVSVNAYHQPGVQAGKKAADAVLEWQGLALKHLRKRRGATLTADEIACALPPNGAGERADAETIYRILEHATANPDHGVERLAGDTAFDARFTSRRRGRP